MSLLVNKKNKDSSTLTAETVGDSAERDFYLKVLNDAIRKLYHKATKGRIKDAKNEKIKIEMFRALFYGVNVANKVYADKQIDKLSADFEKLKKGLDIKTNAETDVSAANEITDVELNNLINFDERINKLKDTAVGGD